MKLFIVTLFLLVGFCFDLYAGDVIAASKIIYKQYNPKTNKYDIEAVNGNNYNILMNDQAPKVIISGVFKNTGSSSQVNFSVRMKITGGIDNKKIYDRSVCIDSLAISNPTYSGVHLIDNRGMTVEYPATTYFSGVPRNYEAMVDFMDVNFNDSTQRGYFSVRVTAEPYTCPEHKSLGDNYPENDTLGAGIYTVSLMSGILIGNENNYRDWQGNIIPDPYAWQSSGAEVINSDSFNWQPLNQGRQSHTEFPDSVHTAIRLNRINKYRSVPQSGYTGDMLSSVIYDLRYIGVTLSFSCQRLGKINGEGNLPRGWADSVLWGPEHRVAYADDFTREYRRPDRLIVDFAWADSNNLAMLANVPDSMWNVYPDKSGKLIKGNPGLEIFGGGGIKRGWKLKPYNSNSSEIEPDTFYYNNEGMNTDMFSTGLYDDGKDKYFKPYFVRVPDYFVNHGGFVRFRFRVEAADNGNGTIKDDFDDFFIDNISLIFPSEITDVSVQSFIIPFLCDKLPRMQAIKIPLRVVVSNNSSINAPTFLVKVKVKHSEDPEWPIIYDDWEDIEKQKSYARTEQLPFMGGNSVVEVLMPFLDIDKFELAKNKDTNTFDYRVNVILPGGDLVPSNDTLTGQFTIVTAKEFSYLPDSLDRNDVPSFSGIKGKGLNLPAYSDNSGTFESAYGNKYGEGTGEIGMSFRLYQPDTLTGFRAYFGRASVDTSLVKFSVYSDSSGMPSINEVISIYRNRGHDDERNGYYFDEYTTYMLDQPVVLPTGTYWVTVTQTDSKSLELGAASANSGMIKMNYSEKLKDTNLIYLYLNDRFRKNNPSYQFINNNFFAYRNGGDSLWYRFTPPKGNTAYSYLDSKGSTGGLETFSGGSWVPMLKPIIRGKTLHPVGVKSSDSYETQLNICPNPADDKAVVRFSLKQNSNIKVALTDLFGNEIDALVNGFSEAGEHACEISLKNYPSGTYFLCLESGQEKIMERVVVFH